MSNNEKKIHRLALAFLMSLILWFFINQLLIEITFLNFIIIQIIIGVGEIFSSFIREKLGLSKRKDELINQERKNGT